MFICFIAIMRFPAGLHSDMHTLPTINYMYMYICLLTQACTGCSLYHDHDAHSLCF